LPPGHGELLSIQAIENSSGELKAEAVRYNLSIAREFKTEISVEDILCLFVAVTVVQDKSGPHPVSLEDESDSGKPHGQIFC
jgi:hypothetical protein